MTALRAHDVLSDKVVVADGDLRVADILPDVQQRQATHVAVFEADRFSGLVRLQDILLSSVQRIFADLTGETATAALHPETPVQQAVEMMREAGVDALPVIDASGSFAGAVTQRSLLDGVLGEERRLRKESERLSAVIAEDRAKMSAVLETAADGIITIDERGIIRSFNAAAERIFAYAADEVVGQSLSTLMPSPHQERHDDYVARHLRNNRPKIMSAYREVEGLRKDGARVPLCVAVSEVHLPGRRLFTGIIRDITERKQAEERLRQSEQDYRTLFRNAHDALLVFDPDDETILEVNQRACEVYAFEREELVGNTLDLIQPEDRRGREKTNEILQNGACHGFQVSHYRKDRSRVFIEISAAEVTYKGRPAILSVNRDITERVRTEEEARQRQAELAHVSRLSVMGEMATGLAHELNQPLCAILSAAQGAQRMLGAAGDGPHPIAPALDLVETQARRAGDIIRRMRRFVRDHQPHQSSVDINELIRETTKMVEPEARKSEITLRLMLAHSLPHVLADAVQIQQVLVNLIRNGFEAMTNATAGGHTLSIESSLTTDGAVEVAVRDEGCGVPDDAGERIFDSFFTTKPAGMGMGLSISRTIVEAHGGRLWATPEFQRGTTFRLRLPTNSGASQDDTRADRIHCR